MNVTCEITEVWEALVWSERIHIHFKLQGHCHGNIKTVPKNRYLMLITRVHAWGP